MGSTRFWRRPSPCGKARGQVSIGVERGATAIKDREPRKAIEFPAPAKKRGRFGSRRFRLSAASISKEADPSDGTELLEWLLPTMPPVSNDSQAREALEVYAPRWRLENQHATLKSGQRVEEITRSTAERIQRAAAINAA